MPSKMVNQQQKTGDAHFHGAACISEEAHAWCALSSATNKDAHGHGGLWKTDVFRHSRGKQELEDREMATWFQRMHAGKRQEQHPQGHRSLQSDHLVFSVVGFSVIEAF